MSRKGTELIYEYHNAVAEIRLKGPDNHNAMSESFWKDFPGLLEQVNAQPDVRVLLLSAEGVHFSAGMDLRFFEKVWARENEEAGRYREWVHRQILDLQQAINKLEDIRIPVICVTQGACLGGALDLVCAADLRVCTEDAYFAIHEINVGMTADLGTLQRLPKLISPAIVYEMAYTGCPLQAMDAQAAGFVSAVCPDLDDARAHALRLAQSIASKSPLAIAGTKTALKYARDHSVHDSLQQVATWNAGMFVSEDIKLGIRAQKQQQEADYQDRLDD